MKRRGRREGLGEGWKAKEVKKVEGEKKME
jgi:hypothetical protein